MINSLQRPAYLKPKPERFPERNAVTVIAGFRCSEGVVVCADSQETVGVAKRQVPKLRFEPNYLTNQRTDIAAAFCGATNNGPFVDKLVDSAWRKTQHAGSLEEACFCIEESIKDTYREFGTIYQPGMLPDAELIYGVKMDGESKLFRAQGPIVNEEKNYASGGVGSYMVDFLACRMTTISLNQLIILAAYVLFQSKEYVDGCGGDSHIAVLPNKGEARELEPREVECATKIVRAADHYLSDLVIECSDTDKTLEQAKVAAECAIGLIFGYRKNEEKILNDYKKLIADAKKRFKQHLS